MAIYHLSAQVISRARGQSAVAAAAYRAGVRLRDDRYGTVHNYTAKRGSGYSEIIAPAAAPAWVQNRETLWNRVESAELRRDAQLARVIEVGLPLELSAEQQLALVRDYVATTFVSQGMIADVCIRADNPVNPQAHIMLTLREVTSSGFGPKARRWNGKSNLIVWRSAWAGRANEHLARAGHAVRIDHRTLEAQQIELTPARRMGVAQVARVGQILPHHLTERIAEQRGIATRNGAAILADPALALRALTHQQTSFTEADLARFLRSRTDGTAQFEAAYRAVTGSPEWVALQSGAGTGVPRFTSQDMIDAAKSLRRRASALAARRGHGITPQGYAAAVSNAALDDAQRRAFEYLVGAGDAKAIALPADAAKDAILTAAQRAWEADGVRTGVVLVEEAEMIGLKQLEGVLAAAEKARSKVVLIGDLARLQSMQADPPFRAVLREIGPPGYFRENLEESP